MSGIDEKTQTVGCSVVGCKNNNPLYRLYSGLAKCPMCQERDSKTLLPEPSAPEPEDGIGGGRSTIG